MKCHDLLSPVNQCRWTQSCNSEQARRERLPWNCENHEMAAKSNVRLESQSFEDEVRRIARSLWQAAEYAGATIIDGRERDGVFETDECIHLIEATISRKKEKAQADLAKLAHLAAKLQKRTFTKAVRGWLVTRDEPTSDQRKTAEKYRPAITVLSFQQFQSQLIDSRVYLQARDDCIFGSVRDPATGAKDPSVDYIQLLLSDAATGKLDNATNVVAAVQEGRRFAILGDYGAGKSMTLRWAYQELRNAHYRGKTSKFPVYVNLRDHHGQNDPTELIERHARTIGFPNPLHLVRAWRAGYIHLLLDGFDEITTLNIQGLWRKLQDNRYRAMEAVRRLVREHPQNAGLVIAGRAHFFDSTNERRRALGLTASFTELSLNEFTNDQVREYLQKIGLAGVVPRWLPSRPLLVAYLASRGLLSEFRSDHAKSEMESDPAIGWDTLLSRIANREAEIEAGIDGGTVRRILERLATKARRSPTGLGPLTPESITEAFREVCGYNPDERGMVLLQRLPGLGVHREDEGTRSFIDEDFVDACRAGDLVQFMENPFDMEGSDLSTLECASGTLGIAVAARQCRARGYSSRKINAAIARAAQVAAGYLTCDLVRVALECDVEIEKPVFVRDIFVSDLDLPEWMGDLSRVHFEECFFGRIEIDGDVQIERLPRFRGCFIGELDGRISRQDLPAGVFDERCNIESFAATAATTNAVMALDLPLGTRVLITVLKKLFQRRGAGRRENALFRGLDHEARRVVADVLRLVQHEGIAAASRRGEDTVWLPDRSSMRRVGRILAAPNSQDDPLLKAVADLR